MAMIPKNLSNLFTVGSLIGRGGFGSVYEGMSKDGNKVAIKFEEKEKVAIENELKVSS